MELKNKIMEVLVRDNIFERSKEITKEIPFTLKGMAEVDAKSVRVSF